MGKFKNNIALSTISLGEKSFILEDSRLLSAPFALGCSVIPRIYARLKRDRPRHPQRFTSRLCVSLSLSLSPFFFI